MPAHNWNKILEKAQTRVESYEKRRLFMPGKILLLNVAVFCMFLPGKYFFAPLSVEFIWSPAKTQMISKQCFYLGKCRGGWDLLHFPSKMDCLFFTNNFVRSVEHHPRRAF